MPRTARPRRSAPRDPACGSTWTRQSSMMPTISRSTRRTAGRSARATQPTARSRVSALASRGAWRTAQARWRSSTSTSPSARARRSTSSSTAARGAAGMRGNSATRRRCSSARAPLSSCPLSWRYRNAPSFGGDATRLYVSGRSSGAHLGGVVATTDWKKDFGLPADTVKGYTLSSGMYDLRAPRLSKRGNYVKFTDEMEQALSPQRHLDRIVAPIVLLYGSLETPEFKRQTREFAEALKNAGKQVKLVYAEGYNHYEIAETIANPYGFVGRAILEQMALAPA